MAQQDLSNGLCILFLSTVFDDLAENSRQLSNIQCVLFLSTMFDDFAKKIADN